MTLKKIHLGYIGEMRIKIYQAVLKFKSIRRPLMWLLNLWSDNIVITLERKDEGLKYLFGYGKSITEVWRDI